MLKPEAALRKDRTNANSELQHRHFATIAAIIRELPTAKARYETATHFCDRLSRTNPRFDAGRFMLACRLSADKV